MLLSKWIEITTKRFDDYAGKYFDRYDASYSAMLSQQLEHMMAQSFDIEYPELKAKTFIPVDDKTPSGAETVSYTQYTSYGTARIGGNYIDDIPLVNVEGRKFTHRIVPILSAYSLSIQDMRAAAMSGVALDQNLVSAARLVIEQGIDNIAAFGNASAGVPGLLNHDAIELVTPDTGTWSVADPDPIIADIQKLWDSIAVQTKRVHLPTHLLVDSASWGYLHRRLTDTGTTILSYLLSALENCQGIEPWGKLDLANATGDGPRVMAYERSPLVAQLDIPQEFEQFEPQLENLSFKTICHARCGGIKLYRPLAFAYMDGV